MNDEELVEVIAEAMVYKAGAGGVLAALRSAGFQVSPVEDRSAWRFCPICGRKNRPEGGGITGADYCSPTNCGAWKVTATFDHATREWVPADSGGSG